MTITEVSKKYGLSADTLRYYERIGLIPPVHRNSSGNRDYTENAGSTEYDNQQLINLITRYARDMGGNYSSSSTSSSETTTTE